MMTEELRRAKQAAWDARPAQQPTATKVAISTGLPSHIDFLSINAPKEDKIKSFEDGRVAIYDDFVMFGDVPFFKHLPVQRKVTPEIKKAKTDKLMDPHSVLNRDIFGGDIVSKNRMAAATKEVVDLMRAWVQRNFPTYRLTGYESHSLRMTETFSEQLHVDSFSMQKDAHPRLRLFVNIDNVPRIWRSTFPADQLLAKFKHLMPLDTRSLPANDINHRINLHAPWDELPAHTVFFTPGTLWVCDSQLVSHEIVYGRKCWAFTFGVDSKSLSNPEGTFQGRMRAAVA